MRMLQLDHVPEPATRALLGLGLITPASRAAIAATRSRNPVRVELNGRNGTFAAVLVCLLVAVLKVPTFDGHLNESTLT